MDNTTPKPFADARHRQQQAFGSGVEGDLQACGQVLDRDQVAAKTHVAQDDDLGLHGLDSTPEQRATKLGSVMPLGTPVLCSSTLCR